MSDEEDKLYSFLTTKQLKKTEISRDFGAIYFYFEDGSEIVFVSLNDNIVIDFVEDQKDSHEIKIIGFNS